MSGSIYAFSYRNRRQPLYLAILADLAGIKPAEHLRPFDIETSLQALSKAILAQVDKPTRHRLASDRFKRTGEAQ